MKPVIMPVFKVICCSSQKSNQKNYMKSLTIKKISKLSDALGDFIYLNATHGKKIQ